jgi:hypothetical protein
MDAFLGRSFPPSHWEDLQQATQAAIDDCVRRNGVTPRQRVQLPSNDTLELRAADLPSFRARFGYGIVADYLYAQDVNAAAAVVGDKPLTPEESASYSACDGAGEEIIRSAVPPIEVITTYQDSLMALAGDPKYIEVSASWAGCMKDRGFLSPQGGPYFAKGIVEAALVEAEGTTNRDLAQSEVDRLQAFELAAFNADSECLTKSGAGSVMMDLEQQLLNQLREKYPSYRPPVSDPSGKAWRE